MKLLKFGDLTFEVELDPRGEEILIEDIRNLISACHHDFRWRTRNAGYMSILNERVSGRVTGPNEVKKSKKGVKK